MSKYHDDDQFLKAEVQFIYWDKNQLRDEINSLEEQIKVIQEKVRTIKMELYSRNLELYELCEISQFARGPFGTPTHE